MQVKSSYLPTPSVPTQLSQQPLAPVSAEGWQCLPLHWFEHCQSIDTQFAGFHITFESAIAIRPSNPRFQIADLSVALMPTGSGKYLKASVGEPVQGIELWLIGSAAVTISALDEGGHCLTMAKTQANLMTPENTHLMAQRARLETTSADSIRFDSKQPFILTRVALKYA